MISNKVFSPDYCEFSNNFFSHEHLTYKDSTFKLGKKSSESNSFTFMVWLKSNASKRSKLFNLIDLHSPNEKKLNFLKIYILNRKMYLTLLEQIEQEIDFINILNEWSHISLTLTQTKEKVEISFYYNGLFTQTLTLQLKKNDLNAFNEPLEFLMGFDAPLKKRSVSMVEKIKEENLEYYRIGPFLFFDEALSPNEINLLYSITDSTNGTINFLRKEHCLNIRKLTIDSIKNFGLSLIDFTRNNPISFSKILIKLDLSYLLNSLCIEHDASLITLLETKDYERIKKTLVVVNKAERNENSMGILTNETVHSNFLYETFNAVRSENLKMGFLVDIAINSLEKTQNKESFSKILKILMRLCEIFQEEVQKEKVLVIYELLLMKKELFDVSCIEEIFLLFSIKVKLIDSDCDSGNILITNLRNFSVFFMNAEFYRTFFRNSVEIINFFELFCRLYFNSKRNAFTE